MSDPISAAAATVWMLIVATGAGDIHHDAYPTEHLCLEARNLALNGETLEAGAATQKAAAEERKKTEQDEHAFAAKYFSSHPKAKEVWYGGRCAQVELNRSGNEFSWSTSCQVAIWQTVPTSAVKNAECIQEVLPLGQQPDH